MKKILIYTKDYCPYCDMAKKLLYSKGVKEIEFKKVDENEHYLKEMYSLTERKTVPQIFIDSLHVGGFDDLSKLDTDGKLDEILKE